MQTVDATAALAPGRVFTSVTLPSIDHPHDETLCQSFLQRQHLGSTTEPSLPAQITARDGDAMPGGRLPTVTNTFSQDVDVELKLALLVLSTAALTCRLLTYTESHACIVS